MLLAAMGLANLPQFCKTTIPHLKAKMAMYLYCVKYNITKGNYKFAYSCRPGLGACQWPSLGMSAFWVTKMWSLEYYTWFSRWNMLLFSYFNVIVAKDVLENVSCLVQWTSEACLSIEDVTWTSCQARNNELKPCLPNIEDLNREPNEWPIDKYYFRISLGRDKNKWGK